MDDVYLKLTLIFQDCFDSDDVIATPTLTASEVEGWDSLANVRLMLAVERAFKIKFSAAEMAAFRNVGDLARAITLKVSSRAG